MYNLQVKQMAFALAEVLITIMIIGLIAVLVIFNFSDNIKEITLERQREVFSKKFQEGLSQMRVDGMLAERYAATGDFVNKMQKYFKINQICTKDSLDNCFEKTFYAKAYYKGKLTASREFSTANLRTIKDLNEKVGYDSEIVGFKLSDGISILISYNSECIGIEAGNTQGSTTACFKYVADVNGIKGPNLYNKDIVSNIPLIHNFGFSFEMGEVFQPTIEKTCEELKAMGIKSEGKDLVCYSPYNTNDYWANAIYKCQKEGKRLPTVAELYEIATALYSEPISASGSSKIQNLTIADPTLYETLGSPNNTYFWAAEYYPTIYPGAHSKVRVFSQDSTWDYYWNRNSFNFKTFCTE